DLTSARADLRVRAGLALRRLGAASGRRREERPSPRSLRLRARAREPTIRRLARPARRRIPETRRKDRRTTRPPSLPRPPRTCEARRLVGGERHVERVQTKRQPVAPRFQVRLFPSPAAQERLGSSARRESVKDPDFRRREELLGDAVAQG